MAEHKVLKVTISGECGVGKSTLARLLIEAVRGYGMQAVLDDEDTEQVMNRPKEHHLGAILRVMEKDPIVLVETVQTIRGSHG